MFTNVKLLQYDANDSNEEIVFARTVSTAFLLTFFTV